MLHPVILFSCYPSSQPIVEVVSLMEDARRNPSQAISLCQQIQAQEKQEDCLLLASEKTVRSDISLTRDICAALSTETKRGECYFRLAEYSQQKEFCLAAGSFQKDCQLHLFSRELFRTKLSSYPEIKALAEEFNILPESLEGETVIYRHILSLEAPIPVEKCHALPSPQACTRAAQGLYLDRLRFSLSQHRFPCRELGELDHSNHPLLLQEYQLLAEQECP